MTAVPIPGFTRQEDRPLWIKISKRWIAYLTAPLQMLGDSRKYLNHPISDKVLDVSVQDMKEAHFRSTLVAKPPTPPSDAALDNLAAKLKLHSTHMPIRVNSNNVGRCYRA